MYLHYFGYIDYEDRSITHPNSRIYNTIDESNRDKLQEYINANNDIEPKTNPNVFLIDICHHKTLLTIVHIKLHIIDIHIMSSDLECIKRLFLSLNKKNNDNSLLDNKHKINIYLY